MGRIVAREASPRWETWVCWLHHGIHIESGVLVSAVM